MKSNILKQLLLENQTEFLKTVQHIPYELKGVSNFEGLCLWSLIKHYKPQVVIESGVARGRSTNLLCIMCNQFGVEHMYAFDKSNDHESYVRQKLKNFSNLTYEIGDSSEKIKSLSSSIKSKRVLAFVDGPKSGEAYADVMKSLANLELVAVVGHDCYAGGPTRLSFDHAFRQRFSLNYDLIFTDSSFCKDKSVNASILDQVKQSMPEKLQFINEKCYEIGVISRP